MKRIRVHDKFWEDFEGLWKIYQALKQLDEARAQLEIAGIELIRTIKMSGLPREARALYREFVQLGGITRDDFRAVVAGKFHRRPVKRKGRLRLIVNNGRRGSMDDDGPRAA